MKKNDYEGITFHTTHDGPIKLISTKDLGGYGEFSFIDNEVIFDEYNTFSIRGEKQPMSDESRNVEGQGKKFDGDKITPELLSPFALESFSRILAKGKRKYSSRNWELCFDWSRSIGAIFRHTFRRMKGQVFDIGEKRYGDEQDCVDCASGRLESMEWTCKVHTGELHVGCVGVNAMFLAHFEYTKPEFNDIPNYEVKK